MRDALQKPLDQLHSASTTGADHLGGIVEQWAAADGKGLTSRQLTERQILLTGLTPIKKTASDSDRAPAERVIGGRQSTSAVRRCRCF